MATSPVSMSIESSVPRPPSERLRIPFLCFSRLSSSCGNSDCALRGAKTRLPWKIVPSAVRKQLCLRTPLPGVVGHSGLQPHWLVRSKARSLEKAVTPVPLAPPYHAHPFRPSAGTSARRPRSLWPSRDDTGGAAALDPRALGTTGAPEPLFHHNHCMLAQDVGWFRAARQAATEGLVTAPARLVGEVSFRVGGYTDKNKKKKLTTPAPGPSPTPTPTWHH